MPANTFDDADSGDTLSYTATRADGSALPSWLDFEEESATFSGTPGANDTGEINLLVTAIGLAGASESAAFKTTIVASGMG